MISSVWQRRWDFDPGETELDQLRPVSHILHTLTLDLSTVRYSLRLLLITCWKQVSWQSICSFVWLDLTINVIIIMSDNKMKLNKQSLGFGQLLRQNQQLKDTRAHHGEATVTISHTFSNKRLSVTEQNRAAPANSSKWITGKTFNFIGTICQIDSW